MLMQSSDLNILSSLFEGRASRSLKRTIAQAATLDNYQPDNIRFWRVAVHLRKLLGFNIPTIDAKTWLEKNPAIQDMVLSNPCEFKNNDGKYLLAYLSNGKEARIYPDAIKEPTNFIVDQEHFLIGHGVIPPLRLYVG